MRKSLDSFLAIGRFPEDKMKIVFSADQTYIPHLAASIRSISVYNNNIEIEIFVLHSEIEQAQVQLFRKRLSTENLTISFIQIDPEIFSGLPITHHFKCEIYFRLLIPKLLPYSKVLYLDADTVTCESLKELYSTNLEANYIAAVRDAKFCGLPELRLAPGAKYLNSGVMLLNLDAWREDKIAEQVLRFVRARPEAIKFADQCGINGVMEWRVARIVGQVQLANGGA